MRIGDAFFSTLVHLHAGPAPVRLFLPKVAELIWNHDIGRGKVFDLTLRCRMHPRPTGQ